MANPNKQGFNYGDVEEVYDEEFDDSSSISTGVDSSSVRSIRTTTQERSEIGLTERLTDILLDNGDGDLLLQRNDREDMVLQWLQALDMQVMGACRADERLKPLLKANFSSGLAEDRLIAHLNQHFELSEVGILARCFCIPVVSIRVGKINKRGTLFCPTSIRGNLMLTVLPSSDLRLSFIGDDGNAERLFTLSSECTAVEVDEIPADRSGRSFHIKATDNREFYFWCSEKSKLLGLELLAKMKDILKRKPSIAELTGISNSRLECFATHLRAYLMGSFQESSRAISVYASTNSELSEAIAIPTKSMHARHVGSHSGKVHLPCQGSLSPRASSFKEGLSRSLSCSRNAAREKLRRCVDSSVSAADSILVTVPKTTDASSCGESKNEKLPEVESCLMKPSNLLDSLGKLAIPPAVCPESVVPSPDAPLFSPYYCWCPLDTSTLQCPSSSTELPLPSIGTPLLPPLSSILSATRSSGLLTPTLPLTLANIPSLEFPAFLPDPMFQLSRAGSQPIPRFTPLICDPIVHVPVIDVCSSGQGYLVSAGPSISGTITPLNPKLVNPLIPETESLVEKGARETLQLLISGSSPASSLIDALPSVLNHTDGNQVLLVTRSRGIYNGSSDVEAIATMDLVSLPESSIADGVENLRGSSCTFNALLEGLDAPQDGSTAVTGSAFDDNTTHPSSTTEESTS
ncbi:hypothetical protein K2173_004991 [Erythroxylum novogranatense]|uniref:Flocculation protein n=1 Tax=Erythroxylum novogranatense TaxID=1862640 RepID=A0AAV8TCT3_9ROSI|nr:hypothetical protein K2173_004991 [Erythroxylum novogranatense]